MFNKKPKYFYTALLIDEYFSSENAETAIVSKPVMPSIYKEYNIEGWPTSSSYESIATNYYWEEEQISASLKNANGLMEIQQVSANVLYVKLDSNIKPPLSLKMWDADGEVIMYSPLVEQDVDLPTYGSDIALIEEDTDDEDDEIPDKTYWLKFIFDDEKKPELNGEYGPEAYKLVVRTLPSLDVSNSEFEEVEVKKLGLAMIFRRNSLDAQFDLMVDFDNTYWHSLDESDDMHFLTRKISNNAAKTISVYTDNVEELTKIIDISKYKIEYSWKNNK